jgi:hypothetical protein
VSSSAINLSWVPPQTPNGVVTHYDVFVVTDGAVSVVGRVDTCTAGAVGCVSATEFQVPSLAAFTNTSVGYRA